MNSTEQIVGIDVGGSSIKAAAVDLARGELASSREVIETPTGFSFDAVVERICEAAGRFPEAKAVGVGFPAAVRGGVIESPPTAHEVGGWLGKDLAGVLAGALSKPVAVANDADCAGMAEIARLAPAEAQAGVVICLTLGTGVGSAVFVDGELVPNTELGKLFLPSSSDVAEHWIASRIKTEEDLSWEVWAKRLNVYLAQIDRLFLPSRVILGGGISRDADHFLPLLKIRCPVVAAEGGNDAGIIGAARATQVRSAAPQSS